MLNGVRGYVGNSLSYASLITDNMLRQRDQLDIVFELFSFGIPCERVCRFSNGRRQVEDFIFDEIMALLSFR